MTNPVPPAAAGHESDDPARVCRDLRGWLDAVRRALDDEIRTYPTPIPRCDAQFNFLYEQRTRLAPVLNRLVAATQDGAAPEARISALEEFAAMPAFAGNADESALRRRVAAALSERTRAAEAPAPPQSAGRTHAADTMHDDDALRITGFDPAFGDDLVRMWRQSFEAAVGVVDPHPIEAQRDYLLTQVVPHNVVRVVWHGERIVGFIAASRASIAQLYLAASHQRRGIGSRLVEWAKTQSAGTLWLYTFARNVGARAFYERHGFRIAARGFEPEWQLHDLRYEWDAHAPPVPPIRTARIQRPR